MFSSMRACLMCVGLVAVPASAGYTYIAGYEPQSEVTQHARIDLDARDISAALPDYDGGDLNVAGDAAGYNTTAAKAIYTGGANSKKFTSDGNFKSFRNIQGFSTAVQGKSSGYGTNFADMPLMQTMGAYWKSKGLNEHSFGDEIVTAALDGTVVGEVNFSTVGGDFRREVIQKGLVYLNVVPYVLWEMQDAVNDCAAGKLKANGDSVHAWDEAVAFYTGSAEGVEEGGDGGLATGKTGYLSFRLAQKRCGNFATCTADADGSPSAGYAQQNKEIFDLFKEGEAAIIVANVSGCAKIAPIMQKIAAKIVVPLMQGTIRYAYKTKTVQSAKQAGELFAFASGILPLVAQCNPTVAAALYNKAWKFDNSMDAKTLVGHLQSTYDCLGITCKDVGVLTEANGYLGMVNCTDSTTKPVTTKATTASSTAAAATNATTANANATNPATKSGSTAAATTGASTSAAPGATTTAASTAGRVAAAPVAVMAMAAVALVAALAM